MSTRDDDDGMVPTAPPSSPPSPSSSPPREAAPSAAAPQQPLSAAQHVARRSTRRRQSVSVMRQMLTEKQWLRGSNAEPDAAATAGNPAGLPQHLLDAYEAGLGGGGGGPAAVQVDAGSRDVLLAAGAAGDGRAAVGGSESIPIGRRTVVEPHGDLASSPIKSPGTGLSADAAELLGVVAASPPPPSPLRNLPQRRAPPKGVQLNLPSSDDVHGGGYHAMDAPPRTPKGSLRAPLLSKSKANLLQGATHLSQDEAMFRASNLIMRTSGDQKSLEGMTPRQLRFYHLRKRWWYLAFVRLNILAQMCLIFIEPASGREEEDNHAQLIGEIMIGSLSVTIQLLDCYVRAQPYRASEHFKYPWNSINLAVVLFNAFDILLRVTTSISFRFSRPLRPLLLIAQSRRLRRSVTVILKSMPPVLPILFVFFIFNLLFAYLGTRAFHTFYHYGPDELNEGDFHDVPSAMLALFVLTTTENFPFIMYPAVDGAGHGSLVGFGLFTLISLILEALLLAVVFDSYKEEHKLFVVGQLVREKRNYLAAFQVIDINGDGHIDHQEWHALFRYLRPEMGRHQVQLLFEMLDEDGNGEIDSEEFCYLADMLKWELTVKKEQPRGTLWCVWAAVAQFCCIDPESARRFIRSVTYRAALKYLVFVNCILLCFEAHMPRHGCTSWCVIEHVFLAVLFLDILLRLVIYDVRGILHRAWDSFDIAVTLVAIVYMLLWDVDAVPFYINLTMLRILDIFRPVPNTSGRRRGKLERLLLLDGRFDQFVYALRQSAFVLLSMGSLLVCLTYSWSVVGMELFAGKWSPEHNPVPDNPDAHFGAVGNAFFTAWGLIMVNNWHDIMYTAIRATNGYSAYFFLAFIFLAVMIILNLVIALVIESFTQKVTADDLEDWIEVTVADLGDEADEAEYASSGDGSSADELAGHLGKPRSSPRARRSSRASAVSLRAPSISSQGDWDANSTTFIVTRKRRWSRELVKAELDELDEGEIREAGIRELEQHLQEIRDRRANSLKTPISARLGPMTPSSASRPNSPTGQRARVMRAESRSFAGL